MISPSTSRSKELELELGIPAQRRPEIGVGDRPLVAVGDPIAPPGPARRSLGSSGPAPDDGPVPGTASQRALPPWPLSRTDSSRAEIASRGLPAKTSAAPSVFRNSASSRPLRHDRFHRADQRRPVGQGIRAQGAGPGDGLNETGAFLAPEPRDQSGAAVPIAPDKSLARMRKSRCRCQIKGSLAPSATARACQDPRPRPTAQPPHLLVPCAASASQSTPSTRTRIGIEAGSSPRPGSVGVPVEPHRRQFTRSYAGPRDG